MKHPDKDITIRGVRLYFLPVKMRVPLKFGNQVLSEVTCARAQVTVETADGRQATGWGETPLSVAWVWPADFDYEIRHEALRQFTIHLSRAWESVESFGHPLELGHDFIETQIPALQDHFNADRDKGTELPHLAALVCFSLLDIATHDAYGRLHKKPIYETYNADYLSRDLSSFLESASVDVDFSGTYPADFLAPRPELKLPVWHLVGGLDPIAPEELDGSEPDDGYPVLLRDWIRQDQLDCLKIKLRGNDADWDFDRLIAIGKICREEGVTWLTTDFNCTVTDPGYVNGILDRVKSEDPVTYQKILYVEQPFPYDLDANRIDVHSVSARKPLFMDESAHDWKFVRMGRELGWTGVALKTCKTQTGALLSLCWAKAHGMTLMVQDLTNPMLAQVPHFLLAAHAETIMGVESNGMQFYPEESAPEREIHPHLYRRLEGILDGSSLFEGDEKGAGFGYRLEEIERTLPNPVYETASKG